MRLSDLRAELPAARLIGSGDATVDAVSHDSRLVRPGTLFVAVAGYKSDGHDFIARAAEAGASAFLVQADREDKWRAVVADLGLAALVVDDTRLVLPIASAAVYGRPARRLNVIGITGTDGKTSLAYLLHHMLGVVGEKAGLISTAECLIGDRLLPDTGRFTTPEAPQVQEMLRDMAAAGCRWAVIEATSHGLALHRVDECEYDIAVFTNLGLDHVDFHGSAEEYKAAKGRLFEMLDQSATKSLRKTAVLNVDDAAWQFFRGLTRAPVMSYGIDVPADVRAESLSGDGWAVEFRLRTSAGDCAVRFPRPGKFNVYNALAAAAVGLASGLTLAGIRGALQSWPGAPGRTELVEEGQPFTVVVDFAHAPDSLRRVLELLRKTSRGRIIALFGCIGERDKDRRAAMGRVAGERADYTIVTDDNPYSEDRMAIIEEIASGLRAAGKREGHDFAIIPDRREAIAHALSMAVDEDAVLLAGKGHEREVHLAGGAYPCDDREVARAFLRDLWGGGR